MPSKNIVKHYVKGGYYHIYNRGVEKRIIFHDREDYTKFIFLVKLYLSPPDELSQEFPLLRPHIVQHNLYGNLQLLAFCLMPNHFHLLIHQKEIDAVTKFMRVLITSYSMYFNKRFERVGPLFQGVFKAVDVESDEYLLHLSRYIHLNPLDRGASLSDFQWSSYLYYLGEKEAKWLNTKIISDYFSSKNDKLTYRSFVEDYTKEEDKLPSQLQLD